MQYNPVVNRRYAPSSRRDDPEWFMLPSTLALDAFRAIEEDHDAEVHDRHQRLVIHRVPTMARRAALRFRLLHAPRLAVAMDGSAETLAPVPHQRTALRVLPAGRRVL